MHWFEKHFKLLFIIPWVLLVLSIGVIAFQISSTGSFIDKGVSLSGGVSATVQFSEFVDSSDISSALLSAYPQSDIATRSLQTPNTLVLEVSNLASNEQEAAELLESFVRQNYPVSSVSVETTGPSLGDAFFTQTMLGVLLAFLWMGWVVYLYFGSSKLIKVVTGIIAVAASYGVTSGLLSGTAGLLLLFVVVLLHLIGYLIVSVPSGAVILAALSTIIFTVAVANLIGLRLQSAGIAAFLMLIGYSVDTDILLSTRMLKHDSKAPVFTRLSGAFYTGITMQLTTTVAILIALLFSSSDVIVQIMTILFIGMIGDMFFTWLQNAGILYWYAKREVKK